MLAGAPPHSVPTAQAIIAAVITEDPRPLVHLRRSVPLPVAAAIHRSLQKIPADRFSSGSQFADALSSPAPAIASSGRRFPAAAGPAVLGIGLAAGVLSGWLFFHAGADATPAHRLAFARDRTDRPHLSGSVGGVAIPACAFSRPPETCARVPNRRH